MPNEPTISIITPCFNAEKWIEATIKSATQQTFLPTEMIVIDDGSTDKSATLAEQYGPPVRVIRQENSGESSARNRGIDVAKGTHLLFLDADDLLHPEALSTLVKAIDDPDMDVPAMACGFFTESPNVLFNTARPHDTNFFPSIFQENVAPIHCLLTPTSLARRIGGFSESLQYFEDWDFWGRLGLAGANLKTLDYLGCFYRRFAGAQSHSAPKLARQLGRVKVCENLLNGMLANRTDLIPNCSETAFWGGWAAIRAARFSGASWKQLDSLTNSLDQLLESGGKYLKRSNTTRLAHVMGIKRVEQLRAVLAKFPAFHDPYATVPDSETKMFAK